MNQPPYLTDAEVREICAPLQQPAAMIRYLRDDIGVVGIKRKPNGMPLVHRQAFDRAFGFKPPAALPQRGEGPRFGPLRVVDGRRP